MQKIKLISRTIKLVCWHLLILFGCFGHAHKLEQKEVIIFVHGTVFPALAFLSAHKTYAQALDSDDWYIQTLTRLRKDPSLFEDSILLEEGIQQIPHHYIESYHKQSLAPGQSKIGAYQAIGAYDSLKRLCEKTAEGYAKPDYYTFGFLGALSDRHRKEAGSDLYGALRNLKVNYHAHGYEPIFTIIGYSHGGNVVLYLASAYEQEKYDITVHNVFLIATPIARETIHFAKCVLFKNIISLFSEGDTFQLRDVYSTLSGENVRALSHALDTKAVMKTSGKTIVDVSLMAADDPQAFGHSCFWYFNQYGTSLPWSGNTSQIIFDALSPLPLVILLPVIQKMLDDLKSKNGLLPQLNFSLTLSDNNFQVKALDPKTGLCLAESENINEQLHKVQDYAVRSWLRHAKSSELTKAGVGVLAALKTALGW